MTTTDYGAEFRRCLLELDIVGAADLWFQTAAHLPQPRDNDEVLTTLHYARTQAYSIPSRLRCYSHAWLTERGLPSGLPDHLKPKADRMYPREVKAVGVAVGTLSQLPEFIERARATERVMSNAVAECYAEGELDPDVIKKRMAEARRAVGR